MAAYPEVKDFIEKHAKGHSTLEIEYVRGQLPQLRMISDNEDEDDEIVNLQKWKTAHIEEYLKDKLLDDSR